jgi:hypothetical protein
MYVNVGNVYHPVERKKQNVHVFWNSACQWYGEGTLGRRDRLKRFFNMTCSLQAGRDCIQIHMRVHTLTHTPNSKGGRGSSATGHTAPEGD